MDVLTKHDLPPAAFKAAARGEIVIYYQPLGSVSPDIDNNNLVNHCIPKIYLKAAVNFLLKPQQYFELIFHVLTLNCF